MIDQSDNERINVIERLTITADASVKEALHRIGAGGEKGLVVVDKNGCLVGTLSDGDIRRVILRGTELSSEIGDAINTSPLWLRSNNLKIEDAQLLFLDRGVFAVPVVDIESQVTMILTWSDCFDGGPPSRKESIDVPVVIMAGGRGTRLAPFTHVLPKPLVPVNAKAIIEHIISQFLPHAVDKFYLVVQEKSRLLRAFFDELAPDYQINFIEETEPLGTAGGLQHLKGRVNSNFIVTNCDILTDLDYADLIQFHCNKGSAITLVGCSKSTVLPYGVCHLATDGYLEWIEEKPSRDILVNTGLYVLSPEVLDLIPERGRFDMTELIRKTSEIGERIGVYPVSEDAWHDVGEWPEYKKTVALLSGEN
jgi:dTDP-glucose pyrophosphorylase